MTEPLSIDNIEIDHDRAWIMVNKKYDLRIERCETGIRVDIYRVHSPFLDYGRALHEIDIPDEAPPA